MNWECLNCKRRAYVFAGKEIISVCTAFNHASNGYAFEVTSPVNHEDWECPKKEKMCGEPFRYIKQIGKLLYCTPSVDFIDGFGNPIDEAIDEALKEETP